jgi:hypothetical protein
MSKKPATLYLVERCAWRVSTLVRVKKLAPILRQAARSDPFVTGSFVIPVWERRDGGFPVRAFLHRGDAEAFAQKEEQSAWEAINPFYYGNRIESWTSLDTGRLCDWLLDLGLEPPKAKKLNSQAWRTWYNDVRASLTDLHLVKLREALDRVRLYRIAVLTEEGTRVEEPGGRWV